MRYEGIIDRTDKDFKRLTGVKHQTFKQHEHIIGRLKVFSILGDRYHNRRKRFGLRFILMAVIDNTEL